MKDEIKENPTEQLLEFINRCPSAYHTISICSGLLEYSGFKFLPPDQKWNLSSGKYFTTRDDSSLIAFSIPKKLEKEISAQKSSSENIPSFRIWGSHSDSPCFKLKMLPFSKQKKFHRLLIEPYGGLLYKTWLDKDFSVAGRVFIKKDGKLKSLLVDAKKAIAKIPNLAIHLNRETDGKEKEIHKENHLKAIFSLGEKDWDIETFFSQVFQIKEKIYGFDLFLYDVQSAGFFGIENEFISAARIDNLAMTHAGLKSIVTHNPEEKKENLKENLKDNENQIAVFSLFNHEEIGSTSNVGAASNFLSSCLQRIIGNENFDQSMSKSIFVSADMAHGLHPNFPEVHDENHLPILNEGIVLKKNANMSYGTMADGEAIFIDICLSNKIPFQKHVNPNHIRSGSTIGTMLAASLGVKTIDFGSAMLGMHSIRETAGSKDHEFAIRFGEAFFKY